MKRMAIFFLLLLSFGLSSCSSTLQPKTNAEVPSDAAAAGIHTVIPNAPVSVVFMGETIMAPGYDPDVPELYRPVLDDLYLDGELSRRYGALVSEGKLTQEIKREMECVHSDIERRGHLPYPGDGLGTDGGYAVLDLDGDGSSELLILDNSQRFTQTPEIKSVFAIRNGRLFCIDNGSGELKYASLTADNTFYQCIDWHGAGYADLKAFRLEDGMLKFTVFSEARAALSFSQGDIPEPYWVKIENGIETSIAEDDFRVLYEQYKHPEELMELVFVPLNPDAVAPLSVPCPTDEPPTMPIEYPEACQGAPEAYKPILDALFLLEVHMRREEHGSGEDLETVGFVEYPYSPDNTLGYALLDFNDDGVLELLLGSTDELNNAAPSSIFTLNDGEPVLLTSFWSRSRGVISADGTIYGVGSGGAAYTYLSSYRLYKGTYTFTELTDIRSDYAFSEEKPYFYQVIEGRNHYISKQTFCDVFEVYFNPPDRMKLTVIPVGS